MEQESLMPKDTEFHQINQLYDECLNYLHTIKNFEPTDQNINKPIYEKNSDFDEDPGYETIPPKHTTHNKVINSNNDIYEDVSKTVPHENNTATSNHVNISKQHEAENVETKNNILNIPNVDYKVENELINESTKSLPVEVQSERLRRLSQQLPKIIITKSNSIAEVNRESIKLGGKFQIPRTKKRPFR